MRLKVTKNKTNILMGYAREKQEIGKNVTNMLISFTFHIRIVIYLSFYMQYM